MNFLFAVSEMPFGFSSIASMNLLDGSIARLLLACLLGGVVGLERETQRKAAGVRTNLLICMGCAFFTMLSIVLAGATNVDKSRVASNIVQGIGFLGAGLILHNRNRVSGMTSAASVFVVASIGMACGAGLYWPAILAAIIVILALELVGVLERRLNLKIYPMIYEVRGSNADKMMLSILDAMDRAEQRLSNVERDTIGTIERAGFVLTATKKQHERLRERLLSEQSIDQLFTFRDPEED